MKVVFVFAHPDDESFTCGGTIAKLSKKGINSVLITATRGEEGQLGSPPITTQEKLPEVRTQELKKAANLLGIRKIHFLTHRDGSLHTVPAKVLSEEISTILMYEKPTIIVTFNKDGGSKHPDHICISKCTTKAFKKYAQLSKQPVKLYYTATPRTLLKKIEKEGKAHYPFGKPRGVSTKNITTSISITDVLDIKVQAMKAHVTQHQDVNRYLQRMNHQEFQFEFFQLVQENSLI